MFLQLFLRPRSPLSTDLGFLQLIQSGFLRPVHKDFYRHKIQTRYLQIEEGRSLKRENNWAINLQNLGCLWLVAGIKGMYWDWCILKKHAPSYIKCSTWIRKYVNVHKCLWIPKLLFRNKRFPQIRKVLTVLSNLKQEVLVCNSKASGMRVVKNKRESTSSVPSSLADNLRLETTPSSTG